MNHLMVFTDFSWRNKKIILKMSEFKVIILTDHDYRNVLDVANRFCMIYDGGIRRIDDKDELVRWGYILRLLE